MASPRQLALMMMLMMTMGLMRAAEAMKYTVGGASGWVVGEDLEAWAAEYTFYVGDELYFRYPYGQSSVLLVSEEDYKDCNTNKEVAADGGLGDMVITLLTPETYFFISGHAEQCTEGLRLEVPVLKVGASAEIHSPPPPHDEEQDTPPSSNNIPSAPVILSPPRSINTPYSTVPRNSCPPPTAPITSFLLLALSTALAFTYFAL